MLNKFRLFFFVVFCVCFAYGFSQDLIIKKDGTKIYCKIVDEDSVSIYFVRTTQKNKSVIDRNEVETYFASKPSKKIKSASEGAPVKNEVFLLGLSAGFANPLGDLGSKGANDTMAGYANSGFLIHLQGIVKLSPFFGIGANYRLHSFSLDHNALGDLYRAQFPGVAFTTSGTNWRVAGFYGNLYFNFPVSTITNLSVDLMLSAGLPKYVSPEFVIAGTQSGTTITISQYEKEARSTSYVGSLGFHYNLNNLLAFNFGVNYMYGKSRFSNVLTRVTGGPSSYHDFEQKFNSFNVELGLAFRMFN